MTVELNFQEFFLDLYNCHTEENVTELLAALNFLREDYWHTIEIELPLTMAVPNWDKKLYPIVSIAYYINSCFREYENEDNSIPQTHSLQLLADGELQAPTLTIYCEWGAWLNNLSLQNSSITQDVISKIQPTLFSGTKGYSLFSQKIVSALRTTCLIFEP